MKVIITATVNQGGKYHTKEDCRYIPENNRVVEKNTLNGNWKECKYCADTVERDGTSEWNYINARLRA